MLNAAPVTHKEKQPICFSYVTQLHQCQFSIQRLRIVLTESLELDTSAFYSHVSVSGMLALIPLHIQKCASSWLNIADADYPTMGG